MAGGEIELKGVNYEGFIAALTILSIGNLVILVLFPTEPATEIIRTVDAGLSIIFLFDFFYRLMSARRRWAYLAHQFGWLDFIGSLPFPPLRLARLYRVVAVTRTLGPVRGHILQSVVRERAGTTLFAVVFLVVVLLEAASVAVLEIELEASGSNIRNASDALWWTWVSVTTVGYGDRFPVTDAGRFIGALTLAVGVALVGALTGFLANAFLRTDLRQQREVSDAVGRLREELAEIRRELRLLRGGDDTDLDRQAQQREEPQPREGETSDSRDAP